MRGSALYRGTIRHRRGRPGHAFTHRVWHSLLDLDELEELAARTPLFHHNRFGLLSFDDRDHMGPEAAPVRSKLARWFTTQGRELPAGRVHLLTGLRQLGWGFNPVSFYFCHDPSDHLRWVVAEVNNTFGETFAYLLEAPEAPGSSVIAATCDKRFHVSPFQPMSGSYRFRLTPPGPRLSIHIDLLRDGERVFDATLRSERYPFAARSLLRTLLTHPHQTAATLGLIHAHALRLWLKRALFFSKPAPPAGAWRTHHG